MPRIVLAMATSLCGLGVEGVIPFFGLPRRAPRRMLLI